MPLLLGTDIGTTGTKTILVNEFGQILASAYKGYRVYAEKPGYAEQEAEDWWEAVVYTIRECIKRIDRKDDIKAISLSTQGGSMVPVDENCRPLCRAAIWMDKRGYSQSKELSLQRDKDFYYMKTGWRLSDGLNLIQIKWLKDNNPEIFKKTHKFISTVEYINCKLMGETCGDPTNAAMTQLLDIKSRKWDSEILEISGIEEKRLGTLTDSGEVVGTLSAAAAEQLGLSRQVKIVSGGHDQYCVALGAGAVNNGDVVLSTGTAWVVLGIFDKPVFDTDTYFAPGNHVVKGKWGALVSVPTGGVSMEWFKENLGLTFRNGDGSTETEKLGDIDQKALKKGPGSGGVMFYPHFTGSSCPTWSLKSKATIMGLDLSHDRYNIARAVMEGVVYDVNWMLSSLKEQGVSIERLKVLGGASRSSLWTRIVADITGVPVMIPESADMACIGAAILAGVGGGIFKNFSEGCSAMIKRETEVQPDKQNRLMYEELFKKYKIRFGFLKEAYNM